MVEAFASVVGKQMLSKVLSLVADEVNLAWGFKDELKRLEKSLEMVQALLSDAAENKRSHQKAVGIWLKKLNAVAYDADALLDEFTYETLRCKVEPPKKKKVRALFRQNMAHKIRSIKESLDEIYKEGTRIGLVQLIGATDTTIEHRKIRLTHRYVDDSEVVGRDDDVSKMVDMMLCPDNGKNLMVIAVVGMAGQGKTTLAKLVCKHVKVKEHFDERIWVVVSEDFDELRLLNEMVQSLTGENPQLSNVDGIIKKKLGKILKGKRYLLVLDDVWSHDASKWETMRNALLEIGGSSGSRIMITTRSELVVSNMQTSIPHRLGRLSEEDSWTMFKQRAFAEGGAMERENLVDIGRKMVKRCGGLPLAIKALGGLMYSKKLESEWLSIQSSRLWDIEDNTGGVLPTLKLSYDHLPLLLKHCFAFCSIFPKDLNLEKGKLIHIWMALGLLQPLTSNDLMEDMGNDYFNALLWNSLLQDGKKDEYDSITSCKMHDVVHDLALDTAKNYCSTLHASQPINDTSEVLHLSLISSYLFEIPTIPNKICSRLQTLILDACLDEKLLANLKCLRVLVLHDYWTNKLPDSVGELKHLRYLDVSKTSISTMPNTITKLYNLQTLRLKKVLGVPKNFGSLINLRHFCIDWILESLDCMLIGIGQLTYLQTLPFFVVNRYRGCHIKELGSLDNLRSDLTILGLEDVENSREAKDANLSKKSHLQTLNLCWSYRDEIREQKLNNDEDVFEGLEPPSNLEGFSIQNFAGGKFPSWMAVESRSSLVLRNLVKIHIRDCNGCERIPPLGHLQYLKVVKIIGMDNVNVIGAEFYGKHVVGGGASSSSREAEVTIFPALRELTLKDMPRLEKWLEAVQQSGSTSVFPCLENLNIENCSSLITIPCHFPSLRQLSILDCDMFLYLPYNLKAVVSDLYISRCPSLSCLSDNLEALERLRLDHCNNLRDIPILPSVRDISILECEKLIGLPSLTKFFPLTEKLVINGCPKLLALPEMHCHTSLRELVIARCEKLTSVPQLCTSLEELEISNCPAMVSFPDFRYLQKLRLFGISEEELDYFPWPSSSSTSTTRDVVVEDIDGIQFLTHVDLKGWPEIKSLPEQLQHLSSLMYLELRYFHGLECLPEWLGNLSSLQSLCIYNCKKLMYMPSVEAMRHLTNLSRLEIYYSPLLTQRCIEGSRPEWEKISHITTIAIDYRVIN